MFNIEKRLNSGSKSKMRARRKGGKKALPSRLRNFWKTKKRLVNGIIAFIIIGMLSIGGLLYSLYHLNLDYGGMGEASEIAYHSYDPNAFVMKDGFMTYQGGLDYKIGIDVSEHQKFIDWNKVKKSGVDFAMIRLGGKGYQSGEIFIDNYFQANIEGAKAAGIDVGIYFFSQAVTVDEAIEEAKFVLDELRFTSIEYPIAFDMEEMDGSERTSNLTPEEVTNITDAFCSIIEKNGYEVMIYGNPSWFYNNVNLEYLEKYPKWLANYAAVPDYLYEFTIWQYTSDGILPGIDVPVDLNIYLEK